MLFYKKYYCSKFCILRLYSSRVWSTNFSKTVKTPKTKFSLSLEGSFARELEIHSRAEFELLYEWQQKQQREKTFVLHDGPPYANGPPHVGHALNKILKDIVNRYKLLRGFKIQYKPGWDCHGTPIEQRALADITSSEKLSPFEIRKVANKYASDSVRVQKDSFRVWGVMADWVRGCYQTSHSSIIQSQLETFFQLYEKGFVFQDYMPIHWSPSSRSALAESEIEYNEDHESTQVFFKLPFLSHSFSLPQKVKKLWAVVWTTTPWTLPFNKAICFGEGIKYVVVESEKEGEAFVASEQFLPQLRQILTNSSSFSTSFAHLFSFNGSELKKCSYLSPTNQINHFYPGSHVISDKGTGLVHTAPAHGVEDFQIALKNNLSLECHVTESGLYDSSVEMDGLKGLEVLGDGSKKVIFNLSHLILHKSTFKHKYPYDWRTKKPVIFRASKQWFINTNKIKEKALELLSSVEIYPPNQSMTSHLLRRDYWCISRQRVWGVPIPVFYRSRDKMVVINKHTIKHLRDLFLEHGCECWWQMPLNQLLPFEVLLKSGLDPYDQYEVGKDILDIWFDSGVTWFSVLKDFFPADVYLEGVDQFGGWFLSSLLTSTALTNQAPFKKLVAHGFTLDEKGRKMSKSLGNIVDPMDVIEGNEIKGWPSFGVDVLRYWAAQAGLETSVSIGISTLNQQKEKIFKLRKSLRFMIGCLHDFEPRIDFCLTQLQLNDQYMMHLLHEFVLQVVKSYDEFNFSRVLRLLDWFNSSQLSAFYFHFVKDRLYCGNQMDSYSAQYVLWNLLLNITTIIAPITPYMAEEIFQHYPLNKIASSVFKMPSWPESHGLNKDLQVIYEPIIELKKNINVTLNTDKPSEFDLIITPHSKKFHQMLEMLHSNHNGLSHTSPLTELCGLANIIIKTEEFEMKSHEVKKFNDYSFLLKHSKLKKCPRCRRKTSRKENELCSRCFSVLKDLRF